MTVVTVVASKCDRGAVGDKTAILIAETEVRGFGTPSAASNVEEVDVGKQAVGIADDGSPSAAAKTASSAN
jgi:hypothetical protein